MATRKSENGPWYCCLPACVSWMLSNFLVRSISILGFQKFFKGVEKQQGILARKEKQKPAARTNAQHSQAAQHHKAAQHRRTQHSAQDNTVHHTSTPDIRAGGQSPDKDTRADTRHQKTKPGSQTHQQTLAATRGNKQRPHGSGARHRATRRGHRT